MIRRAKFAVARRRWQLLESHVLLRSLDDRSRPAQYLTADYPDCKFRAACRCSLGNTRVRRNHLDPSVVRICPLCAVEHNGYHVLLVCPAFNDARNALRADLLGRGYRYSYAAVLGDVRRIPPPHRPWFLQTSLRFLRLVYQALNVP